MTIGAISASQHVAQFYESDAYIVQVVRDFVATGLRTGEAVVVIASAANLQHVAAHLHEQGIDVDAASEEGRYVPLDATDTLIGLLVDGQPDPQRFAHVMHAHIGRVARSGRRVRVYGEMVAVLAEVGTFGATFALEQLWNDLQRTIPFSLMCGYPIAALDGHEPIGHLRAVCSLHQDVVPAESYTAVDDPHEQQRLITELQQKARRLEAEIAERRQTESRLQVALAAAEAATRAKADFLATVSHEVRTPLNAVIGMSGLLLTTALTSEQQEYAETVRSSSESLLEIINDILDFSKLEAGKIDLEIAPCDIRQVIDETMSLVAAQATAKGLDLASLVTVPQRPRLLGDAGRLRQILLNLVNNAVKFTDSGTIVVRADIVNKSAQQTTVRYEVQDPGVGIEPQAAERLFLPFTQADSSTTRRFGGTGLGLAIARRLVDAMHGEIGVTSAPGRGSVFWFTVPMLRLPDPSPIERITHLSAPLRGTRCLVAGLDDVGQKILCAQLQSWGMIVESVTDATAALAHLRGAVARNAFEAPEDRHPFDLIISDSRLDSPNERSLVAQVRADVRLRHVRIVRVGSLESAGRCARAAKRPIEQATGVLHRPLRQSQLYDCLVSVIAGDRYPPEPLPAASPPLVGAPETSATTPLILLAEDNPVNQKVALRLLARLGFRADAVANGLEALDALGRTTYAAVLMDCQMPDMDGYEASRRIRRLADERSRVPIIALTASAQRGDRERCLAAGMSDYLAKPIREADLAAKLKLWVGVYGG